MCKHENYKRIMSFDYQWCGGYIEWCADCGAYSKMDEYAHHDEKGNLTPEKWEWELPNDKNNKM